MCFNNVTLIVLLYPINYYYCLEAKGEGPVGDAVVHLGQLLTEKLSNKFRIASRGYDI